MNVKQPERKPRICFICPYCYPLFHPNSKEIFGGSEVRVFQIAQEIARKGHFHVCMVVADHEQPHHEKINEIELISWKHWDYWNIPEVLEVDAIINKFEIPVPAQSFSTHQLGESNIQAERKSEQISLREIFKPIYKKLIPWKIRIILHGIGTGLFESLKYLKIRGFPYPSFSIKTIKESMVIFARCTYRPYLIAKIAWGHIGDEPIFHSSINTFEEANADIYVVLGNNFISAWTAYFCKKNHRKYVMISGSDIDFSPEIISCPGGVDLYFNLNAFKKFAIQSASVHIVQHEQQAQLARNLGIYPQIILNPLNLTLKFPKNDNQNIILWIGNSDERVKRPSLIKPVAEHFTEYSFIVILTPAYPGDFERWLDKTFQIPNITSLSNVPFSQVEEYFAKAHIFLNTSSFEGFPNTFLQAGKYGLPVVSLTADPNEMISRHGCGILCNDDINQLSEAIKNLMENKGLYDDLSQNISGYVRKYHDMDKIIPLYEKIFTELITNHKN